MSETPGQVLWRIMGEDVGGKPWAECGPWTRAYYDDAAAAFLAEIDGDTILAELARRDWDIRGVIPNERRAE